MFILIVAIAAFWLASDVANAAGITHTVNTTTDNSVDTNPGDGSCTDTNGRCSLRAAIMEANATSGSATIIVPAGTYTLTSSLSITSNVTIIGAGGNSNGDPKSTIIQAGSSAGSGTGRVFDINPNLDKDLNVTIQSVWVRYGKASGGYGGGGIAADAGEHAAVANTIHIDNCYISDNTSSTSDGGGGLNLTSGKSNGFLKVTRTTVSNNTALAGNGGGIYVQSYGLFQLDASTIENNSSAAGIGGGLYLEGTGGSYITNSTIAQNTASSLTNGMGGGIYTNSSLTLDNSTINGNTATLNGGGVYVNSALASLFRNNTINANKSTSGNGGGIHVQANAVNVELHNNIVVGNSKSGGTASDISGNPLKVASSTNNLVGTGGAGGLTNGTNGNQTGVTIVLLGPLANNGGATKTQALLPGSPALDAGDNANGPVSVNDQRGFARKAHGAGADISQIIDIGAFEANPTIQKIADKTMNGGDTLQIPFYVGDVSLGTVTTTATSGDTILLPAAGMSISGTGARRTLNVTPALGQQGTTAVTITATSSVTSQSVTVTFNLTVQALPDLDIKMSHTGNFHQNQIGAQYTITVKNIGNANTSGTVTVRDTPPADLTITSMNGSGWTCQTLTFTCTRSDILAPGSSYPSITVTADVAGNASTSFTNVASVAGGGDPNSTNNISSDPTIVESNSTISPTTGSFDKKLSAQADVSTTMTLNGNTLISIVNGGTALVSGTDYTATGNTLTIKKEYLAAQPDGTTMLVFSFNAGATQTLTITVSDTTPQNSTINPTMGSFDKKLSVQSDVSTTMTLNGNTLSSIANSGVALVLGTDYTVSGNTLTIKKEYLATMPLGTTSLTFNFSAGATQTLTITVSDTTPQNSTISPATGSFDKKLSAQADVSTTMTLNGNTLSSIVNGGIALVSGTDYTGTGNTLTIKKEYLATMPLGTTVLTFNFSAGATKTLTITVSDTTTALSAPTNFRATAGDRQVALSWNSVTGATYYAIYEGMATGIYNGTPIATVTSTTYNVTSLMNGVTFYYAVKAGNTLESSSYSNEAMATPNVSVRSDSTISPTTGSFDKKLPAQADVITTMTLNGNTLSSIVNGATALVPGTAYTVSGSTVTIKKEYLATMPLGTTVLTFNFSAGATQTLTITVSDTTPKNSAISPTTGSFDKKLSAQADVITTMMLNGNTLSSIAKGTTPLVLGTDYTVSGSTVTIKKGYLSTQPLGTTALTFGFSAGATQTLTITVSDTTSQDRSSGPSLSNNTDLKVLKFVVDGKELSISPDRVVETGAEQIEIHAEASDPGSTVSVQAETLVGSKRIHLSEGDNAVVVSVKAPDGTVKSYTYTIHRTVLKTTPSCMFTDISGHWAAAQICEAALSGIAQGDSAHRFHPDDAVTRAEFVTMLIRALEVPSTETTALSFTDQDDIPKWAQQAIRYAVSHGIVDGYPDGAFRPQNTLSRMEVAVLIAKALKLKIDLTSRSAFEDDSNIPAWAKPYVQADVQQGILQGREYNRFMPNDNTTRAEAVTIILRVMKTLKSN
jgi:hypothetical protein